MIGSLRPFSGKTYRPALLKCGSGSSPSTVWVSGIELRLGHLASNLLSFIFFLHLLVCKESPQFSQLALDVTIGFRLVDNLELFLKLAASFHLTFLKWAVSACTLFSFPSVLVTVQLL